MTAPAQEQTSPAAQAMAASTAIALATQAAVGRGAEGYLGGRIERPDFITYAAGQVLRGISAATLAGHRAAAPARGPDGPPVADSPRLILDADQERIEQAITTVTEGEDAQVTMRAERLARAEVVAAGRTAYVEAVGDDPSYSWAFTPSPGACARCLELAAQIFDTYVAAPRDGGHVGCSCVLDIHGREDKE